MNPLYNTNKLSIDSKPLTANHQHLCIVEGYSNGTPRYNKLSFPRDDDLCDFLGLVYTNNTVLQGKPMLMFFKEAKCYPQ